MQTQQLQPQTRPQTGAGAGTRAERSGDPSQWAANGAGGMAGLQVGSRVFVEVGIHNEDSIEIVSGLAGIQGVEYAAPFSSNNATVKYGTESVSVSVIGTNPDYAVVRDYGVASGRFIGQIDLDFYQKIALLGSDTAATLFGIADPIGEFVQINGTRYKVVGLLAEKGDSAQGSNDEVVMVPLTTAERLFQSRGVRNVYIQVGSTEEIDRTAALLENELSGIFRENTNSYRVFNQQQVLEAVSSISATMSLALGGIASISLLVGGIGIMNIMLVSVTERTREIGIRKAIGAKKRDILMQFLIEAITLSCLGGILGIGFGAGYAASSVLSMDVTFTFDIVVLAFGFSVAIGVLFGLFPASKAANLTPIDALRFQ
jgi:putative ABC transport system permease protein